VVYSNKIYTANLKAVSPSILLFLQSFSIYSQAISPSVIASLAEKTLITFDVPGITAAVVKDGKIIHTKVYEFHSLSTMQKVDAHTHFKIVSNTKASTTAALTILVDEYKIIWDDKVIDHIPGFKMYNPYVMADFTISNLLTYRSVH